MTGCKIIHNESFKDNICSIGMSEAVVWFRRVHFQKEPPEMFLKKVFLKNWQNPQKTPELESFFLALLFFLLRYGEIWLGWMII